MGFVPGLELCRRFHDELVAPIMARRFPGLPYDAGRLDSGSELLGFDTERSMDHDWGPRLRLFLRPPDVPRLAGELDAAFGADLPDRFLGLPVRFRQHSLSGLCLPPGNRGDAGLGVLAADGDRHGVTVTSLDAWFKRQLGFDPRLGVSTLDWLATPTQRLAELTGGAVYHDGLGALTAARERLRWYPTDVWRYVLACQWTRLAQEEHLVGRCAEVGDELGSAVLAARVARDLMRLGLLLHRRYPPYGKWLGTALARLPAAAELHRALAGAVAATRWPERERQLCRAYEIAAAWTNATGLAAPLDTRVRQFHDRPLQVIDAGRFAAGLRERIGDPWLRELRPLGAVDQHLDSTDALRSAADLRAIVRAWTAPGGGQPE